MRKPPATTALSTALTALSKTNPYRLILAGPLFPLGSLVATPAALKALAEFGLAPHQLLNRHVRGDWGDLDAEGTAQNDLAVHVGARLLSSYTLTAIDRGKRLKQKVWVITEADRASTTVLLPDDY